ncbi:acyl-CoA dehydrogenase family protein [Desertibacillus haloalkaliphilus]|uniref:acyl-CoA dehydrogenase family protein n=1 Tax=Desertibacillus haloalkaliphilus TaxID=1328930 RepID=UPI001C27771F|nr:acyl-CoA dehydrogenase family protein [Desertibacillus haloalkaliphilus]MBU8906254.1 acyl-CoA dehydrogenase family protein [Desertibacillus haloalkaliphilus]
MYDFSPTVEQEELLAKAKKIMEEDVYPAEKYIVPGVGLPNEILKPLQQKVKDQNLWAAHLPEHIGGLGLGNVFLGLLNEQLGSSPIGPRVFGTAAPDTGNTEILLNAGTQEQIDKYLKPVIDDEIRSCFAMTERDVSGADPTGLQTTAVKEGNEWVINGRKWFISNAGLSSFAIVMAVTNPDAAPHERASMFLVDIGTPGFNLIRDIEVMGDFSEGGHWEIEFDNCRIPEESILGKVGEGFKLAQMRLGPGRITHAMRWLGVMNRSFDLMLDYALKRKTRGKPLAEFQSIQNFIADSAAEMSASRLMTLHAAWKMDQGLDARKEIALIKFYGAKILNDIISRAIQVHGSLGYSKDTPLEAFYREGRAAHIYDGPDEVHRMVVAKRILKEYKNKNKDILV